MRFVGIAILGAAAVQAGFLPKQQPLMPTPSYDVDEMEDPQLSFAEASDADEAAVSDADEISEMTNSEDQNLYDAEMETTDATEDSESNADEEEDFYADAAPTKKAKKMEKSTTKKAAPKEKAIEIQGNESVYDMKEYKKAADWINKIGLEDGDCEAFIKKYISKMQESCCNRANKVLIASSKVDRKKCYDEAGSQVKLDPKTELEDMKNCKNAKPKEKNAVEMVCKVIRKWQDSMAEGLKCEARWQIQHIDKVNEITNERSIKQVKKASGEKLEAFGDSLKEDIQATIDKQVAGMK